MADTQFEILCPACGKPMTKLFIAEKVINIDVCENGCGGIFFDNREFEKFDEAHETVDEILNVIKGKDFAKVDDTEVRVCPIVMFRWLKWVQVPVM